MFTRVPKMRLCIFIAGLIALSTLIFMFSDRSPSSYPLETAGDIEKIVIKTECSLTQLSISSLPFKPAIVSNTSSPASTKQQDSACRPQTPLFIGFSENEPLLAQTILSYIACGWPSVDIVVVDNTGTFGPIKNNASLDHDHFRQQYGVNILQTPAQLSFSQLQNFCIYTATLQGWQYFFWSHMDVVALSHRYPSPSLYQKVVSSLENITTEGSDNRWAFSWYYYDNLSLVNVLAATLIGLWDIEIPYYASDCDYYTRSRLRGFQIFDFDVGRIFDVGSTLPNTQFLLNGSYDSLYDELQRLEDWKKEVRKTHKSWQGWDYARQITIKAGRQVFKRKWGTDTCDIHIRS